MSETEAHIELARAARARREAVTGLFGTDHDLPATLSFLILDDVPALASAVEEMAREIERKDEALRLCDELFEAALACGHYPKGTPEYGEALACQGLVRARMLVALSGEEGAEDDERSDD